MIQNRALEIWKEYVFQGVENRTNYKLEVSNYGRLCSYNLSSIIKTQLTD